MLAATRHVIDQVQLDERMRSPHDVGSHQIELRPGLVGGQRIRIPAFGERKTAAIAERETGGARLGAADPCNDYASKLVANDIVLSHICDGLPIVRDAVGKPRRSAAG